MKVRILAAVAALALGTAISGGAAQAATYMLTVNGCSSNCLGSNTEIGTVTVTQVGGALDFTVALDHNAVFNSNGNGEHHAFTFDLSSGGASLAGLAYSNFTTVNSSNQVVTTTDFAAPTVTNKGVTTLDPGPFDESPFGHGTWSNAIDYVGTAGQGHAPSNFSFQVKDTLNNLSLGMLTFADTYDGKKIEFAADVYANGTTGNVGAVYSTSPGGVPEPASWAMMIMGVFTIGAVMRQRRKAMIAA